MHTPGRRRQKQIEKLKAKDRKINKGIANLVLIEKLKAQYDIMTRLMEHFCPIGISQTYNSEEMKEFFVQALDNKQKEIEQADFHVKTGAQMPNKQLQEDG